MFVSNRTQASETERKRPKSEIFSLCVFVRGVIFADGIFMVFFFWLSNEARGDVYNEVIFKD